MKWIVSTSVQSKISNRFFNRGFFPVYSFDEYRTVWYREMMSIVEYMRMSYSDALNLSICDRKSFVFAHNQMKKDEKEKMDEETAKAKGKNTPKALT